MKRSRAIIAIALILIVAASPLFAQKPVVSEKKDVAIFALGYYGWSIPQETLGGIDMEIQKVFVDLGRFNIIGMTSRLSSGGLEQFIATLKKAKEANFVMPEKYQFAEAILTEADFNKLLGAFIVAAPVVSNFNSFYNSKSSNWETEIKTNVTFIDVAGGGSTMGIAEITTSGSDKQNQNKSISAAIEGIPMQLQYEIRKIPAFQINTRVLTVSGNEIKLQLGRNMGIQKGDEYSIIVGGMVEGFKDEREEGLVLIKDVGAEVSTGNVLYSSIKLTKDVQLREIPRLGIDAEVVVKYLIGKGLDVNFSSNPGKGGTGALVLGLKSTLSRGFYDFRPFGLLQVPVTAIRQVWLYTVIPVSAMVGGEYNLMLGRLSIVPSAAAGASYIVLYDILNGQTYESSDSFIPHVGFNANVRASILLSRDMKVWAEGGYEYWLALSTLYSNYGGLSVGGGVTFKL